MESKEREAFLKWHFETFRSENMDLSDEEVNRLYERIHSHFHVQLIRDGQFIVWQAAKAKAVPEGFVLVPRVITDEWMAVYIDPVVSNYCKDYENLPFSVEDSELPEIRESHRLPIRNAHKRLMRVIEAQEQRDE